MSRVTFATDDDDHEETFYEPTSTNSRVSTARPRPSHSQRSFYFTPVSFSRTQSSIQVSTTQHDITPEDMPGNPANLLIEGPEDARTEIEELELRLDQLMAERVQIALELQRIREGFNEAAPLLGNPRFPSATKALKFLGVAYWSFFVTRFLCLADLTLLVCLVGSVALICLTFAFATEQSLFFWPFTFVALLETLISVVQFMTITMLAYRSKGRIGVFMNTIVEHEDLFGNSFLDEMTNWEGVALSLFYVGVKIIVFPLMFLLSVQVSRIFYDKDDILHERELRMEAHNQTMLEVMQRLEGLRRAQIQPIQNSVAVEAGGSERSLRASRPLDADYNPPQCQAARNCQSVPSFSTPINILPRREFLSTRSATN